MLEKPDIQESKIIACLQAVYPLRVKEINFLPLGADRNTAVYRIWDDDGSVYFLKLRSGEFNESSIAIPNFLSDQGIKQIIPAIKANSGQLYTDLPPFKIILYPFIYGQNGFEKEMTDLQWVEFGKTLKKIHTSKIPVAITSGIQCEDFSPHYRNATRKFLEFVTKSDFTENVANEMANFIKSKRNVISELVTRAERFAEVLLSQTPEFILCHGDIHGWNLLIHDEDSFYIVDWDTLIYAPKERDLMFIGGGLGGFGHTPAEEVNLFYQGYGVTEINPNAMAYYRYERIVEDIAIFCDQVFMSKKADEDRKQAFEYLKSNFLPNNTIDIVFNSNMATIKNFT